MKVDWSIHDQTLIDGLKSIPQPSARDLAREIGCGRGAVIGRIRRMSGTWGLALTRKIAGRPTKKKKKPKRYNVQFIPRIPFAGTPSMTTEADMKNSKSQFKELIELKEGECRHVVNDRNKDDMHLFCGNPVREGSSFCHEHYKLVYQPRRIKQ